MRQDKTLHTRTDRDAAANEVGMARRKYRFLVFFVLVCLGLPTGCATMTSLTVEPQVYGGIRGDAHAVIHLGQGGMLQTCPPSPPMVLVVIAMLDFPFSLVADTMFLPYTVGAELEPDTAD